MGMMGFWVTHPKAKHPLIDEVQRDFASCSVHMTLSQGPRPQGRGDDELQSVDMEQPCLSGIDSLNVRLNDKVRIRMGNLTMTNHPMHVHGHEFWSLAPMAARRPKAPAGYEVTTDVAVGQMRQIEFVAEEGDWAFHCHKSHHTMNAMGRHSHHDWRGPPGLGQKINNLIPTTWSWANAAWPT